MRPSAGNRFASAGTPARRGFLPVRAALLLLVVGLGLVRFWLNPPLPRLVAVLAAMWLVMAVLFYVLKPAVQEASWLGVALRLVFFAYEATVLLLISQLLGGSGWLAILLLVFPVLELNLAQPRWIGRVGSLLAVLACTSMVLSEASGWLPHDPFYAVSDPLYRQPGYVAAVLLTSFFVLFIVPAAVARYARP